MPDLTGPEMDKRIALALGYKVTQNNIWSRPPDKHGTIMTGPMNKIVPGFHRDFNAIWEVRQNFTAHEKNAFQAHLVKLAGKMIDASPRDHAEAWLLTKTEKTTTPELAA